MLLEVILEVMTHAFQKTLKEIVHEQMVDAHVPSQRFVYNTTPSMSNIQV